MHKMLLTSAALVLFFAASGANALASDKDGSQYVSMRHKQPRVHSGSSSTSVPVEYRAAYSASDLAAAPRDSAFSPQQDESYAGR